MPVFQAPRYNGVKGEEMEGLNMLEITNTAVPRDEGWHACRRAHDARRRERYPCMLLLLDGKSCPESAQWLYRDEETIRAWLHAFKAAGLHGLERAAIPGRPA
jgi:transposase